MRDRIRTCHPSMADARNTPLWLYKLLKLVQDPPVHTRNQLAEIATELTTENVNNQLRTQYHQPADAPENPSLPVEYVQRWTIEALSGLIYAHNKARTGFEFQKLYDLYMIEINELNEKVNALLLSLLERNTVNDYAIQAGDTLQRMKEACERYVRIKDPVQIKHTYFALQEFREIDRFDFVQ